MSQIHAIAACVLLAMVGCDARTPAAAPATGGVPPNYVSSGMEFSGERNCVDCDGIGSWLRLEEVGTARRYRMVEVYYGKDHDRRFEDSGAWSTQDDLLRLRSSQGGERVYARMQDGYLQARGARGQRIPAAEDDVLVPAGFDSTR